MAKAAPTELVFTSDVLTKDYKNLRRKFSEGEKVFLFTGDTKGVVDYRHYYAVSETPEKTKGKQGFFIIVPKDALREISATDS